MVWSTVETKAMVKLAPMWRALHSLISGRPNTQRAGGGSRTVVIALVVGEHDRDTLAAVSGDEALDVRFPETRVGAWDEMTRFRSPVILYDRDWPNAEWRSTVYSFANSPQRPCVILTSRVADEYLWQELIRWGGHDLLAKPLRREDVSRALKLALSYGNSARATAKK